MEELRRPGGQHGSEWKSYEDQGINMEVNGRVKKTSRINMEVNGRFKKTRASTWK